MTLLAAGITQTVIQEMMPPYSLNADLLAGAVTILPPPPPDASASWRQARLTRLVREISVLMPADAAQAKLAAQIVVYRETADDTLDRANVPGLTVEQVCRVRRAAADLTRTSATLERALSRRQEQPAPFFGTVLADQVDIAALDAVWCKGVGADRLGDTVGAVAVGAVAVGAVAVGAASVGMAAVGVVAVSQPVAPAPAALESTAPEHATPEPAAPEPAASEPATPEPELAAGIAPAGLEPAGLSMAGSAASERVPAGFTPVGFEPVAFDPAGLDPAALRPGSESVPQATPVSDPTVRAMAGLPGGSAAAMHDGRMAARAA
jgi:hypothetical protein